MPSPSSLEQIRGMLAASRADADRILATAARQAEVVTANASVEARWAAERRLRRVEKLRGEVQRHSREIERAYAGMVESLSATARRLVEITREADFRPPEWRGGLDRTIEIKLSETRELTLRLGGEESRG